MCKSADIAECQNREDMLKLLAAQRQMYSDAKRWKFFQAVAYMLIPLLITFAQIVLSNLVFSFVGYIAIETILFVAGKCFGIASAKRAKRAAGIQQLIDLRLFGFENKNLIKLSDKDLRAAEKYERKHGLSDLVDWYGVDISRLTGGCAASVCQRINISWSTGLEKCWMYCISSLSLIAIALTCAFAAAARVNPFNLVFIIGCIELMIERMWNYRDHVNNLRYLQRVSNDCDMTSPENILFLQSKIYESRKVDFMVPDWFYKLFKDKFEKLCRLSVEAETMNRTCI